MKKDMNDKKCLEDVKRRFMEMWEYIQTTIPNGAELAYAKDFDPVRAERRAAAVVGMLEAAKEQVAEICPDIPGVFSFMEDWIEHNLMPFTAYDYLEGKSSMTLACTLWMLDELQKDGVCLDGNYRLPPLSVMREEISAPGAWDAIHETDSIITLLWIIQHRNDDCAGMMEQDEEMPNRFFMDRYTAANVLNQEVVSRKRFRQILNMIPQESIDRAVKLYKATFEDILERIYRSRAVLVQELQELDEAAARQEVVDFRSMIGSICVTPQYILEHWNGPEVAEIWEDFEISDPYALCFAFLYLLDTGDDMPWVYSVSLPLMEMCASVLPWGNEQLNEDGESLLDHYMEDAEMAEVPKLGDWFAMIYENVDEMDMNYRCSCNLAQMVYWATMGILPRDTEVISENPNDMELFGETAKRDMNSLVYWLLHIAHSRYAPPVFNFTKQQEDADSADEEELLAELEETAYEVHLVHQEMDSLRNLVFALQEGRFVEETEVEGVLFPYNIRKQIAILGGNDDWIKEIESMLENVLFVERTEDPDVQKLTYCNAIWVQTNTMSHSTYDKVIEHARRFGIPVRYFTYASAVKCAEQLAVYDMEE